VEEGTREGGWAGKGRKVKRMYPVACERHQKSKNSFLLSKCHVCVCARVCVRVCRY
jgi:hypothetical protein